MIATSEATQAQQPTAGMIFDDKALPKLTRNEKKIFGKLDSLERAAGAYELLDLLRSEGVNAIPTVYRALNGLMKKGLVRHITSTKTYVTLTEVSRAADDKIFLVCSNCQNVSTIEANDALLALKANAEKTDFSVQSKHMEFLGICCACKHEDPMLEAI